MYGTVAYGFALANLRARVLLTENHQMYQGFRNSGSPIKTTY